MAALAGYVARSPARSSDAPSISADVSELGLDYWPTGASLAGAIIGGAKVSALPVSAVARAVAAYRAHSYSDDYYHRIHYSLASIGAGNLSTEQVQPVEVWNAYLVPQILSGVTAPEGVSVEPSAARTFAPLELAVYDVTLEVEGPPTISGAVAFEWLSADDGELPLSGSRIEPWVWLPDWSSPVLHRFEFKVDVLPRADGSEQRIDLRLGARRTVEFSVQAQGQARRYLEAALWNAGAKVFATPLWEGTTYLTAAASAGASTLVADTALRDFYTGGSALLMGEDPRASETVVVDVVGDGSLTLAGATVSAWPAGTRLVPTRPGYLAGAQKIGRFTGDATLPLRLRFELTEPWDGEPITLPLYRGQPVLTSAPNWARGMSMDLERALAELDGQVGPWTVEDRTGLPVASQTHGWTLDGREAIQDYLGLLALLRGRLRGIWVPTFADDLTLVAPVNAADTVLTVEWAGFAQHLVDQPGRRDIRIELRDGSVLYTRVTGATEFGSNAEQLTISPALGVDVTPAEVAVISFMALSRQASDAAELSYWTAEVAEASTTWRTFKNEL